MALFQYFPNNYIWNLAVNMALESGGQIGEIEDMCRPLLDAAARGADAGTAEFLSQWVLMADKLLALAAEDEAQGRLLSASRKGQRAALYLIVAERMQGLGHPNREATFARAQQAFRHAVKIGAENAERVEIPYEGKVLPALLTYPPGARKNLPCVLYVNGLDSCKELLYWSWLPRELARRGIATLSVDQPGTGEALRLQGLPATHASERWATPCYDWLAAQGEFDAARIGMAGISLGGYFTPRAMAFEPRFASGAVWGANHDWAEVQHKRLQREGENPVPHYWNHVQWVFGARDRDDFFTKAEGMRLDGILDRIRVPFLVTHGEKDRQIALAYAQRSYEQLVNSPRRELKVFTAREGGVEHVGADNMTFGRDYIADWFAETLGGSTGPGKAPFRRIVTGHDAQGRAVILDDAPPPRVARIGGPHGPMFYEVWNTRETPASIDATSGEPAESGIQLAPPKNGTRIRVLEIPPEDASIAGLTPEEARAHFAEVGAADAASHSGSGSRHAFMHRTETIDYGIVLEGEITLIVDEGETVCRAGDIVIQRGTNHGWANRGKVPCRIAFILIDGKYDAELAP